MRRAFWRHGIEFDYIDVGANFGMTVCVEAIFHKRCGHVVQSHAFEPGDVYDMLERTVRANGLSDNITCNKLAASDAGGIERFHMPKKHSAGSSLLRVATSRYEIPDVAEVAVKTIRLDDYGKTMREVPGVLIKIDAEGADFRVIEGMSGLLQYRLCTLLMEFTPVLIVEYAEPAVRLYHLAKDFLLIDMGEHRAPILSEKEWISDFVENVRKRPRGMTDIVLIPRRLPGATDLFVRILVG